MPDLEDAMIVGIVKGSDQADHDPMAG